MKHDTSYKEPKFIRDDRVSNSKSLNTKIVPDKKTLYKRKSKLDSLFDNI